MLLSLTNQKLRLEMNWYEKLFAFHFGGIITIPIAHITAVSTTKPEFSWAHNSALLAQGYRGCW
jgi:NhaP-type Na+/H+ or K+/H+ antiporter